MTIKPCVASGSQRIEPSNESRVLFSCFHSTSHYILSHPCTTLNRALVALDICLIHSRSFCSKKNTHSQSWSWRFEHVWLALSELHPISSHLHDICFTSAEPANKTASSNKKCTAERRELGNVAGELNNGMCRLGRRPRA